MKPFSIFSVTVVACAIAAGLYIDQRENAWCGRVARSAIRKAQARARIAARGGQ